jgi:sugar lactone lactonase YvrE
MKNKLTKTKFNSVPVVAAQLFSRVTCLGAIVLICASASAQNLFVSGGDPGNGKIFELTPDGVETTFASGLNSPQNLAFDSEGNLFVVDSGAIYKFTPDGVRTTFALGLPGPLGLAFDSAGNLFVVDGGNIDKFTPEGVRTTFAVGLDGPFALAIDSEDNLFVTDSLDIVAPGHAHIYKFTPDGARTTLASGLLAPTGLAFDSTDNLFVVDEGDIDGLGAAIYKFTLGGVRSTFASPFLCIGAGLAIDEADNLFVPDWCTGDIHMFTRTGGRSTFVSGSTHNTGLFLAFQPVQITPPPPPIVATPSVSPNGGKFRRQVIVTLTDATPGTTIYYMLDGSDPTTTSIPYQGTFVVRRSATVKAIAVDSSLNESGIATASFRIRRR